MSDIALFYRLIKSVEENEQAIKDAQKRLNEDYATLVLCCPHSEAVERKPTTRGIGIIRKCKICGITDYASEGGTPGDEYDYGYPGYPSKSFWSGAEVETVDETEFDKYSRSHDWVVSDGKPKKRFE